MKDSEEVFLTERNDAIDNAVFEAICSLVHESCALEWDMEVIGEIEDVIESSLIKKGIITCHPWCDEDENICYKIDRCPYCERGDSGV